MPYLLPADYTAFGLAADTPDSTLTAATAILDAHCRRPTLLAASYTERFTLAAQTLQLTYTPVASLDAVRARYARPRNTDGDITLSFTDCIAGAFGLPNAWVDIPTHTLDLCEHTGTLTFAPNPLGFRYTEAEVAYTAGLTSIPDALKVATAQIVRNMQATPALNIRSTRMDTLATEYFSDSLLDSQVRALLRPFVAERLG